MAFYEGIDEEIYEGGDHYIPMQQFRLNQNYTPAATGPVEEEITETFGIPYTGAFTTSNVNRNDLNTSGFGQWGNLDKGSAKQFNIDGNIVTGYKNLNTGLYQDYSGLNIQNLGIQATPLLASLFNIDNDNDPTYPGLFNKVSLQAIRKNPGIVKQFFARQDVAKQAELQKEIDRANKEAAVAARYASGESLSDIGADMYTGEGKAFEAGNIGKGSFTGGKSQSNVGGVPGGEYGSPKKDGGRVGLNYGGLASMLGRENFKKGGKARIGFFKGAQADTKEGKAMSPGTSATGGLRTGADGPDNKDRKKLTISPVIDTKWTDLGFEYPTGVFGFDALTPFGKLKATANLKNYITGDDVEPTLDYQGNIGPVDINATYSNDVQNINATINNNNWNAGINYDAITGDPTFGINYSKTFKHGGLASIL